MWRLVATNFWLRHVAKRYMAWETSYPRARSGMDHAMRLMPMPAGTVLFQRPFAENGRIVPATRIDGPEDGPMILWFHGGAYCLGSPSGYAPLVSALARRAEGQGVLPDYRLAPEHPFPVAVDDCILAYRGLLTDGIDPNRIILAGDSAGGGLAFAVLHLLLREKLPAPAGVVALSPWVDMTASGESYESLAGRDVLLPVERLKEIRDNYLAGADPRDPRASPAFGIFKGSPRVFILSSRHEILRDDSRMMVAGLRNHGADVTHEEWDSVPHVWPIFQGFLPEADTALDRIAAFIKSAISVSRL